LARARQHGYLDARRATAQPLLRPYALWCWQMKMPLVWLEKRTRHSRYARLRLDLFTTADMLTPGGQSELSALGASTVSPHDAVWDQVPHSQAENLAHAVLRTALRPENKEPNRLRRPARLLQLESAA